jgi:UDP-glucose 4-epimerase
VNFLITGASGFVGRNFLLRAPADWRILAIYHNDAGFPDFVSRLNRPGVTAAPCDLSNPAEVAALFERHGQAWDSCLYLAAKVDIPWSVREPKQDLLLNSGSLLNVLEAIRVGRFIYFSSGAVYDGSSGEVRPDMPVAPTLPYAISKLACESYVRCYCERKQSIGAYLVVRFFGAYGPYEAPSKVYNRLIRAFALEHQDTYTIYGDGRNLIDAMYVDDAVTAIELMLAGKHWNDTVNLAGGRPIPIETLVREVGEALGVPAVKIVKQGIANEHNEFWGSTQEMGEHFGFECRTLLAEGITRFRDFVVRESSDPLVQSAEVLR